MKRSIIVLVLGLLLCAGSARAQWMSGGGSSYSPSNPLPTNVGALGIFNVQSYGAIPGNPITCTSNGTTVLTGCSGTGLALWTSTNLRALIPNGGITSDTPATPSAPTCTGSTAGAPPGASTGYQYEVVDCALFGPAPRGATCSAASAACSTVTQAALVPGTSNYSRISLTGLSATGGGVTFHKIYRSISGGPFVKLDETTGTTYNYDYGQPNVNQNSLALDDPATAPASAVAETIDPAVSAVAGTSITLASAPTQTGTLTLYPESTLAFQAAWDAAAASGGGSVYVPAGTYYCVPTPASLGGFFVNRCLEILGPTYSNITMQGAGPHASILRVGSALSAGFDGSGSAMVEIIGATSTAAHPAQNASLTTSFTATVNAGDQCDAVASTTGISAGDLVFLKTGDNVAGVDPTSEINVVASVNSSANQLCWKYPAARLYQQEYWVTGTSGQAALAPLWSAFTAQGVHVTNELVTCATNCPSGTATIFKATASTLGGNIGATEPNWNTSCPSATNTCTDGNVTWTNLGTAAAQTVPFGVYDLTTTGQNLHDIVVRDMGFVAPQGGVSANSTGIQTFNISLVLNSKIDNIYSETRGIGAWAYMRKASLINSWLINDKGSLGVANSDTDMIVDGNYYEAGHGLAIQFTENSIVRVNDNYFYAGFPLYNTPLSSQTFAGGPYALQFTNNKVCGHSGAGLFSIASTVVSRPSQSVLITGNTFDCPYGAAFPDEQNQNKGGTISLRDANAGMIADNSYLPSGNWDQAHLQGIPGFGYSGSGSQQCTAGMCTWAGSLKFSQATTTTVLPLGTIPANTALDKCEMRVTTAFNAATTNVITIGGSTTQTTYLTTAFGGTSIGTGLNRWDYTTGLGVGDGTTRTLNSAGQNITSAPPNSANNLTMYYSFTGTAPTTGAALVFCYGHLLGQ